MKKITKIIGVFLITLSIITGVFFLVKKGDSHNPIDTSENTAVSASQIPTEGIKENQNQQEVQPGKKYGDVKGFLWEVKKGNSTVYMYGSIHVGDKNIYPLQQVVEDAFDSSKVLVGEIDLTDTAEINKQSAKVIYSNGETVFDHITSEGRKKVEEVSKELNFDPKLIAVEKVWAFGSFLSQYQVKKAGYDARYGIDMYFMNKAKGKKKIIGLEGAEFQFDLLNSFSDEEQEKYFIKSLSTIADTKKQLDEMFSQFKAGDEKGIEKSLAEEDKSSNYYKKMISDRNKNMASKIEEYLNTGDTYFVVVGLAHYVGDDGVVKLLQQKGYTVTRK